MLESLNGVKFEYKRLTESEQKARGILGRLVGPIADFKNPTRNGRKYSEKLWENVFANPIMQEKIKNRVCFGELGHPTERTETDIEKVAICLAEQPKKGKDGKIYGVFDILSTPNGKLLKTLCDYGCNIGISSRGQGDLSTDEDGDEAVDPDTYDCECWDAVLVPGVETARLKYVNESLNKSNKLKLALTESLNAASDEARRVMEETLSNLNIQLNEAVAKEFKLDDCVQLKDAAEAKALVQKLKANWSFGAGESLGVDTGAKCFEMFTKEMDLYVYEDGEDSLCFGIKKDGSVYGPFNINNEVVKGVNISVNLPEAIKEDLEDKDEEKVDELKKNSGEESEEEKPEEEIETVDFGELSPLDVPEEPAEDIEDTKNAEEAPEENADEIEVAKIEEPETTEEKSNEEIFLDFLANNFDEDQVKEVAKILDIEIVDEDGNPVEEKPEENSEEESTKKAGEKTAESDEDSEDINSDEEDANEGAESDEKAVAEGFTKLVSNLKEALKVRSDLEAELKTLQEKLAVSEAKVNSSEANNIKLKESVIRLSAVTKSNKDLKEKTSELDEALKSREDTIIKLTEKLKQTEKSVQSQKQLNENLDSQKSKVTETTKALNEQITINQKQETEMQRLTEQVNKQTSLKESYKKLANKAVNKYIDVKAETLGLTPQEIKRKLGESYTMEDVDQVCEDLKKYYFDVSNLPFQANRKIGVRVNENASKKLPQNTNTNSDDEVDDLLMKMARFGG